MERRSGGAGAESTWSTVGWFGGAVDAAAIAILPHGLDGHAVKDVITGMGLERSVLLTPHLHVRAPAHLLAHQRTSCTLNTVAIWHSEPRPLQRMCVKTSSQCVLFGMHGLCKVGIETSVSQTMDFAWNMLCVYATRSHHLQVLLIPGNVSLQFMWQSDVKHKAHYFITSLRFQLAMADPRQLM